MGRVVRLREKTPIAKAPLKQKLTKRVVEAIEPDPAHEVQRWDSELRGFGVRVLPSGVRTYIVQYRDVAARTRKVALGRHGVITTEQARDRARQELGNVAGGKNPSVERKAIRDGARGALRVKDVAATFLAHVERRRKPSTVVSYRRLIGSHILPRFGATALEDLTHHDVARWHAGLGKTPYEANRALAVLSAMFSTARLPNACRDVERFPEHQRRRFYSAAELRELGKVLATAEHARTEQPGVLVAIRLLALTGCRLGEVLRLRWRDVDLKFGALRLQDAKAGARDVPLSGVAVDLLTNLPRFSEYVVPGTRANEPLNPWTMESAWQRIRERAGLDDARLHDLRHTVGTFAGAAGLNAFAVRDLLGHKTLAMTGRYVSQDMNPLRRDADKAVEPIARALFGTDDEEPA